MAVDRARLLESARECYEQSQDVISTIAVRAGKSVKESLVQWDKIVQWTLFSVAACDGYFMKTEAEFITNFTDFVDAAYEAEVSWMKFTQLSGEKLKNAFESIRQVYAKSPLGVSSTLRYYATSEERVDLEVAITGMCMSMAEIDGDAPGTDCYKEEWLAGMKAYYSLSQVYGESVKKTTFHNLEKPYINDDIAIFLDDVECNEDPEVIRLSLSLHNHQGKEIRIWIKDYGFWLPSGDTEIEEGYINLCTLRPYEKRDVEFFVDGDKFSISMWPSSSEFDAFVFMIAYDFWSSTNEDIIHWVIDEDDITETMSESWAEEIAYNDDGGEPDEEDDVWEESPEHYDSGGSDLDTSGWSLESILKREGYTVSQREGLTDYERHQILDSVLSRRLMTKRAIVEHIETQIALRRYNSSYREAIEKWKRDLEYLETL